MKHDRTTAEVEEMETAQDLARDEIEPDTDGHPGTTSIEDDSAMNYSDPDLDARPLPAPRVVLSYKELKVAQLRVEGKSAKEIAFLLDRSKKTIDNHLTAIHKTLGIHSKEELPAALARYMKGAASE